MQNILNKNRESQSSFNAESKTIRNKISLQNSWSMFFLNRKENYIFEQIIILRVIYKAKYLN